MGFFGREAGPSTALRFAQDDNIFGVGLGFSVEKRVLRLRWASLRMTIFWGWVGVFR